MISLIFACLYQWKTIICVGIILAICAGGFQTYKYYMVENDKGMTGYQTEMEKFNVAREQYNHSVAAYDLSFESIEAKIESLLSEIENSERYCLESPKMMMNPEEYYTVTLRVYIETNYQILPDMTYQNIDKTPAIISAFMTDLNSATRRREIAVACGFDSIYLDDVYSVFSGNNCFVYVTISGPNQDFVAKGVEYLTDAVKEAGEEIESVLGDFELVITNFGIEATSSLELLEYQESKREDLTIKKNDLVLARTELSEVKEPLEFNQARPNVLKKAIKTAIFGGAAGALAVAVFFFARAFFGGKLLSNQDVSEGYGIKYLGHYSSKKYHGLTGFFRKKEGKTDAVNRENDFALIAKNISIYSENINGKIFLTGSEFLAKDENLIESITRLLPEKELVFGESFLKNVEALSELNRCEAVVLIETCNKSSFTNIEQELQTAENLNKQIIGIVIEE